MKRETVADLWALGIVFLTLSIIVPMPWLELKDQSVDPEETSVIDITPIPWATRDAGAAVAILLICGTILIGTFTGLDLFRWSVGGKRRSWHWGGVTILLAVLAVSAFSVLHSMYGRTETWIDGTLHVNSWYPQFGFYITIFSTVILAIAFYQAYKTPSTPAK
jgi:hypothetical protein